MQIRTDTWHYQVWNFTYCLDGLIDWWGRRPYKPSLCQYWRRILLFTIPTAILVGIGLVIGVVVFLVTQFFWVSSGTGIYMWKKDGESYYFPPVSVGRREIQPQQAVLWFWGTLALAGALYYGLVYRSDLISVLAPLWRFVLFIGPYVLAVIGIVLALALIFFLIDVSKKSEGWKLFRAYVKAKKDGICPLIEFVEVRQREAS